MCSIQPPAMPHQVYTAEKTIVKGGHFWAWETMHMTELGIEINHETANATNAEHHGAKGHLYRIAIALAHNCGRERALSG